MKLINLKPSLNTLVSRCLKNDSQAQFALYEMLGPKMMGVCRRYVKSTEEAEEVLANGFVKVFAKIDTFQNKGSFEGWVRKIMVRESLNYIRYQRNIFVEPHPESNHEPGHDNLNNQTETDELLRIIDMLPIGYKTVFNLYAIEGFAHKEIAETLGISENTSKSQLSKARKFLKEQIEQTNYLSKT